MTDAYVFDHVRTPRGRGKPDGALHEVAPCGWTRDQALEAVRDRNELDTSEIDDVVMGCVDAGRRSRRRTSPGPPRSNAGYDETVAGQAGQPVLRVRPGGGQQRRHAVSCRSSTIMSIGGGVESMSADPDGLGRRRLGRLDPQARYRSVITRPRASARI